MARGDRHGLGRGTPLARLRYAGAVRLRRRADLLGARPEPRGHRHVRRARRPDERLQHPLPGADLARVLAVRRPGGRVRRREGNERDRDVARGDPRMAARATGRRPVARVARRSSRGRPAVDGVLGDARDRDAVLSARAPVCVGPRPGARATDLGADCGARRHARRSLRDPVAGTRFRGCDRAGAARPRAPTARCAGDPPLPSAVRRHRSGSGCS